MKVNMAKWFNNHKAPAVLMIDDLSDGYVEVYKDSYKNDWGYLCNQEGSAFNFLQKKLLDKFSDIKITLFTPYDRHNVINPNGAKYKKFAVNEREEFVEFLNFLQNSGHEIAHHGSNHGEYRDINNPNTQNGNFIHEWELFKSVDEGVEITKKGVEIFNSIGIDIVGGKFCGYKYKNNSLEIIDKCNFLYWCVDSGYKEVERFGKNRVIKFPTTFAGNSFVRLSYKTGNLKKDFIKLFTRFLQPFYNKKMYKELDSLYENGDIISIQEHISPSTSSGLIQSANIVTDIDSLNKIFSYLSKKDIWYATCKEISEYIEIREFSSIKLEDRELIITLNSNSKVDNGEISLKIDTPLEVEDRDRNRYKAVKKDNYFILNLPICLGKNSFKVIK